MSNHFLAKGFAKKNDDDDLVQRQLSELRDAIDTDNPGSGIVDTNDTVNTQNQTYTVSEPVPEVEKKSVLQQGMVVSGSITSATALFVYGTVNGDIICESDLTVDGNVDGNVKAENIQVLSGHIKGDIECKSGAVAILKGAIINGNIHGESLCCDGEVEGNTNVGGKVAVKENAVIMGDIACEKISICEGAVCKGKIETNAVKVQSTSSPESNVKADKNSKLTAENSENLQINIVTDLKNYV